MLFLYKHLYTGIKLLAWIQIVFSSQQLNFVTLVIHYSLNKCFLVRSLQHIKSFRSKNTSSLCLIKTTLARAYIYYIYIYIYILYIIHLKKECLTSPFFVIVANILSNVIFGVDPKQEVRFTPSTNDDHGKDDDWTGDTQHCFMHQENNRLRAHNSARTSVEYIS